MSESSEKRSPYIPLEIIYEDEDLVAINKPHGLIVHRSRIARDATEFAIQILRDQIGMKVYPAHRIDRKTSGVLLFAKDKKSEIEMQKQFQNRKVVKTYEAIVRGYTPEQMTVDYPIGEGRVRQEASTSFKTIQTFEIDIPLGKHETSRYSLIELLPATGRFHQIRKHLAHIFHPIIGDRPHGCNKQNRLWKNTFHMTKMMLHAKTLEFERSNGNKITISANRSKEFERVLSILEAKSIHK